MLQTAKELLLITFLISSKTTEARKGGFLFICIGDCSSGEYILMGITIGILCLCCCAGACSSCIDRPRHDEINSIELINIRDYLQNDQQPGIRHQHEEQEATADLPAARKCSEDICISSSNLVSTYNPSNDSSNRSEYTSASPRLGVVRENRFGQVVKLDCSDEEFYQNYW